MNDQEQLVERLTRFYRETRGEVSSTPPLWVPGKPRTMRWLQPVLASVALIAVAAGLAVTVRTVRDEAQRKPPLVVGPSPFPSPSPSPSLTPSPTPSPSATATWITRQVPIGSVVTMSLDSSAVFALYNPGPINGRPNPADTMLARIDRATAAVTTAGPFPQATTLARVTSGLWIGAGANQGTAGPDTQWLTLLDPVALKVKQRVHLPGQPSSGIFSLPQVAGTSDLLWLAYGNSLYRLDAATGRVLLTQNLGGTATGLSIEPSSHRLYAGFVPNQGNAALVIEWDGLSGRRIASAPTGGVDLGGPTVVAAPDGVWITYATGMQGAVEHRADTSLSMLAGPQHGYSNAIRAFVARGALWLVDAGAGGVACADLRTGTIAAHVEENLPAVIVADSAGSYLGNNDGVDFLRPDPACPH
jgi:hypothetical protein